MANPTQRILAQELTDLCMAFLPKLCEVELYSYQREIAERIFFSLLVGDAEEITVQAARQSGKSEALADAVATAMVLLPLFSKMYPDDLTLSKFKSGLQVGVFGPTDFQADNIHNRVKMRLESDKAKTVLSDPDLQDAVRSQDRIVRLTRSRSYCRKQTAYPGSKIESSTYHLIILDEAQDADSTMVRKSIHPMTTAFAGTIVKVGTPAVYKSDFYEAIQRNRTRGKTNGKRNHFHYNWKRAAKENPFYAQAIDVERERLGEDSDEFRLAYEVVWLLERGMFITDEQIEELGDESMSLVWSWSETYVVAGLDVAQKHDSTVLTVLWVDWEHPDEFGFYDHRVLSWLEIHGEEWELQYARIVDHLSNYRVMRLGVDSNGMGDPVAHRMQLLLPNVEVVPMNMDPVSQSERWTHLMQLVQRKMIGWPASDATKKTLLYRRFTQQLRDVEKEYKGRYMNVTTPRNEKNVHDDFVDSLALGCYLTKEFGQVSEVEVWSSNPFFSERGGKSLMSR